MTKPMSKSKARAVRRERAKIFLVDDHPIFREGLTGLLNREGDFAICGEADAASQALAAIHRLFAADPFALKIIAGLAEGLTASEICRHYDMAERDYDTARKRMRRALLRCGLAGGSR